jgi:DNA-binding NarL/FixJ family response regulator
MSAHHQIQIAIADDEALFRRGMRLILEDFPDLKVLMEAENGEDLLQKIRHSETLPDVLLLDLKMPVMNGIEAAEIIRKEFPSVQIIVISSHVSKAFILNMIEIGAAAYLGKNSDPEEVAETIRMVSAKGFYYNNEVMEVIRESMVDKNAIKPQRGFVVELTGREKEVLQLICEEKTNQEIADQLYLSSRTVEGHRNNMLSKLGCRNTAGLVVYAIQQQIVNLDFLQSRK